MIFSTEQLTSMRATQASHMNDTVNIINRTPFYSNGETLYIQVVQSGVACGFDFTGGKEIDKGQVIIVDYDADVRLPLGTEIGINDWVVLTTLAGEEHDEVFEVFEAPRFGTTALHVNLKQLDAGIVTTPISAIAPQGSISELTPKYEFDDNDGVAYDEYYVEIRRVDDDYLEMSHFFGHENHPTDYPVRRIGNHIMVEFPFIPSEMVPYKWAWYGYPGGTLSEYYYFTRVE